MNSITRLIAVIFALRGIVVTIASERKQGNYTFYTLTGFPQDRKAEIRVSGNGNLWSDEVKSFQSVPGELVRYETHLAYADERIAGIRQGKAHNTPAPHVLAPANVTVDPFASVPESQDVPTAVVGTVTDAELEALTAPSAN